MDTAPFRHFSPQHQSIFYNLGNFIPTILGINLLQSWEFRSYYSVLPANHRHNTTGRNLCGFFLRCFRGERGIRTPGGVTLNGFQDRRNRPLCHLSEMNVCMLRRLLRDFASAKIRLFSQYHAIRAIFSQKKILQRLMRRRRSGRIRRLSRRLRDVRDMCRMYRSGVRLLCSNCMYDCNLRRFLLHARLSVLW